MVVVEIIFWLCLLGMLSTYVLYPTLMILFSNGKKQYFKSLTDSECPLIEMIFAAHNEESVLEKKIRSVLNSNYPPEKLSIRVGSDCSTDKTNEILKRLAAEFPLRLKPHLFTTRQGKAEILNQLSNQASAPYLLLTDANIMFHENTIRELASALSNKNIGACGGIIEYQQVGKKGIARQENDYLNIENRLKVAESRLFKLCMGLEGGCYLIRKEHFCPIPARFFMEDFFITLHVLSEKKNIVVNENARVSEDISVSPQEEFNRKVRISIGNFQNLNYYKSLLYKRFWPVGFSFLLHKIFRWLTPFFMIIMLGCLIGLSLYEAAYLFLTFAYGIFLVLGIMGMLVTSKRGGWLNYPGHFIYMNLALLRGFIQYIKGVESNAWQPTARNQK